MHKQKCLNLINNQMLTIKNKDKLITFINNNNFRKKCKKIRRITKY